LRILLNEYDDDDDDDLFNLYFHSPDVSTSTSFEATGALHLPIRLL